MAEYNFVVNWEKIPVLGKVKILTEQVVTSGGGGGGSVTVDDEMSSTSENPVQNKVIYSALQGKADTSDMPLIGTYTESGATVVGTSVTISLTYAQITAAIAAGRPVFLTNSTKSHYFACVGTHAVNGTTSHVFTVAECSVNGDTLAKSGSMRTIVYPSSGSAYMYSMSVSSTITASDTNPVNSVAVIAYINSLDASNVGY